MRTPESAEYVTVESAGNIAGISPRTLRYWISAGKLSAVAGKRGKLVKLSDVQALADLTGKGSAENRQEFGNAGNSATSAETTADEIAGNAAVTPAALSQLDAIRDQWLQPLIDQIRELERERGRIEEQRDSAIAGKVAAEAERDELRAEVELLREIRAAAGTLMADENPHGNDETAQDARHDHGSAAGEEMPTAMAADTVKPRSIWRRLFGFS